MKRSILDRVLHKDQLIGRAFVKAEAPRREQLMKFREQFNRGPIRERKRTAAELKDRASMEIPESDGFLFVPKPEFPEIPEMIDQAKNIVAQNNPEDIRRNAKDQLLTGLLKKDMLGPDSPFFKFVMRPEIVATVSNYLGLMPILTRVDVWYSKASAQLANSQLHHCDFESLRQIKLFVYVSDVTEATGPLTVMKASDSDEVRRRIKYRFGQKIEDAIIDPIVAPGQQFQALGKSGSMVFADTSRCFHYGSRVQGDADSRTVIIFQFLRPQSFHMPLRFVNNCPYSTFSKPEMPEYQRQLLGAE